MTGKGSEADGRLDEDPLQNGINVKNLGSGSSNGEDGLNGIETTQMNENEAENGTSIDSKASGSDVPVAGRRSFAYFICLLWAFAEMGITSGLLGPSILSFGQQTDSSLSVLEWVFTARSLGLFAGTMIAGKLIDVYPYYGRLILLLASIVLLVMDCIVPLIRNVGLLIAASIFHGTSIGFVDNTSQVLLIREFKESVGPYMQALHCSFGAGAFFAPIILSPFLSSTSIIDPVDDSQTSANTLAAEDSSFRTGWYICAATGIPGVVWLLWFVCRDELGIDVDGLQIWLRKMFGQVGAAEDLKRRVLLREETTRQLELQKLRKQEEELETMNIEDDEKNPVEWHDARTVEGGLNPVVEAERRAEFYYSVRVVICVGIFLTLYVGCETGYGSYIYSYAVRRVGMSADAAAYLNSGFWGSFALGRFVGIFLSPVSNN